MSKTITRRDILKFTGGSILGILLSPLPWKLLDDSAIWTQNWSLTPKLAHGPIGELFSHCTLCPAGCAVKARTVAGMPFQLTGVKSHPLTNGVLCPRGLASHHMAYHPLRIAHAHRFTDRTEAGRLTAISTDDGLQQFREHLRTATGSIAVLDRQPERSLSSLYRSMLKQYKEGIYLTSPSDEKNMLETLRTMLPEMPGTLGFDFDHAGMIVSFGAALQDGWGTPGMMNTIRNRRSAAIVQIDSRSSRTALQADQWLATVPGTERSVALSIAFVLLEEHLLPVATLRSITDLKPFQTMIAAYAPERTAAQTGLDASVVRTLARRMAHSPSTIVLCGSDAGGGPMDHETERSIAALNILLGSVGITGGIVQNGTTEDRYDRQRWNDVPDHSIGTLIIDGADDGYAIPWELIERKLIPNNALVVSLSPMLDHLTAHADLLLPGPAHFESLQDVRSADASGRRTFALSVPLLPKHADAVDQQLVLTTIATALGSMSGIPTPEEEMKRTVAGIHSRQRGTLYSYSAARSTPVSELGSADELWTALQSGAIWMDATLPQRKSQKATLGVHDLPQNVPTPTTLMLMATGWRGGISAAQVSPVLSKVFQESDLRPVNGVVLMHPSTAEAQSLADGATASLSTVRGTMDVLIRTDRSIRPGIVEGSIAPAPNGAETPLHPETTNLLQLCAVCADGTWRMTPAQFLKA